MNEHLGQSEFEDLSAWLDGELPSDRAAEVERLVREAPAWARAAEELRTLNEALDGYVVAAPDTHLARRILANLPARELTDSEADELSAYLDGELPAEAAEAVAVSVRDVPAWRQTLCDYRDLDALLDRYTAPSAPAGLARRVTAFVRRRTRRRRVLAAGRWLAPVAAAALVLIGLALFDGWRRPPVAGQGQTQAAVSAELQESAAFEAVPVQERPALQEEIIRHLDFFQDYEVVADLETLEAIEKLDEEARGI